MDKLIEVKPFAHLTEVELAWVAGLIDGEGCITISKNKPHGQGKSTDYRMVLVVVNTYKPCIDRLHSMFGVGTIKEYVRPEKHKNATHWICYSGQAKSVVEAIRPYLFIKARDADILLEFSRVAKTKHCQAGVPPEILEERERLCRLIREDRTSRGRNGAKPKSRILEQSTLI